MTHPRQCGPTSPNGVLRHEGREERAIVGLIRDWKASRTEPLREKEWNKGDMDDLDRRRLKFYLF